jgi:hypothetical protein
MVTSRPLSFVLAAALVAAAPGYALDLIVVEPQQVEVTREQYLQWAFGSTRTSSGHPVTAETRLRAELDFIGRACELTDAQWMKLEVAGRGDIHRFVSRVECLVDTLPTGAMAAADVSAVRLRLRPLTLRYQCGLHGQSSLLRKTLRTTLDARQLAVYEVALAARREEQYRANIATLLESLGRNRLQITAEQKRDVTDLLVSRTSLPDCGIGGAYGSYYVYHALSVVPEQELRTIVGEQNWPTLSQYVQIGRTYAPILKAVEDEEFETVGHLATR